MDVIVPLPEMGLLPDILRSSKHWIIWKAEYRDGKVAKIPCDWAGETDSMKSNHMNFDDALASATRLRKLYHNEMFGVGISFTDDIGIVGVDLDAALVNGLRADHLAWMLRDYPTWGEVSLSGIGAHLFYRGRFEGKRNAVIDGLKFEIFGTKGFIAITGKQIPDSPTEAAAFEAVSVALDPFLEEIKLEVIHDSSGLSYFPYVGTRYGEVALQNQCDRIRGAINGTLHHTVCSAAASVGRLIPHYISDLESAFNALYQATAEAGGKDMQRAAKTIRGQLEFGMTDPARPKPRDEYRDIDLSGFGSGPKQEEEEEKAPKICDPGPFPEHLLEVPGFIGDVCRFTNQNSFVLQPVLALAGALALLSVLTGRKVKDKDGVRTNLYVLSVAGSGEGKDAARKTNKKILFLAGGQCLLGPESWASGSGLLAAVEKQPAILFQNDEIGRFLQTTNDAKKAPHLFSLISILLKLYSSADDVFLGEAYADGRQKSIHQPHAVLFGTTVPGSLYSALSEDSITNGLMGRLLIFEAPERQQPAQDPVSIDPPASIVDVAKKWVQWQPKTGNLQGIHPEPRTIPVTTDGEDIFRLLRAESRDQRAILGDVLGSLWVRCVENARKLALLYACSEYGIGEIATVGCQAARWACDLTRYLVRKQCFAASLHVARNHLEATSMEVERIILSAGHEGMTGLQLMNKTRHLSRRDRAELVGYLLESGKIKQTIVKTNGRPKTIYKGG